MANFACEVMPSAALYAPLPGSSTGTIGVPPPGLSAFLALDAVASASTGATALPLGESEPTVAGNAKVGLWLDVAGMWFDRLHVLPREPIDFGRVIAQVDEPFEVHSAFSVPIKFSGASIPPGSLSIPGLPSAGATIAPFGSMLDPSSTPGVPVRLDVRAAEVGAFSFNGAIAFSFVPGGVASIAVVGQRFQVIVEDYEAPLRETLSWATNVIPVSRGKEQRIARRELPRQSFSPTFMLSSGGRRRMHALLFGAQGRAFGFPLWTERVVLTAAASPGATTLSTTATTGADLRAGGYALLFHDASKFDAALVSSVGPTSVGIESPGVPSPGYSAGDLLVPLRIALVDGDPTGVRFPVTLEELQVRLLCLDNSEGAPTGDLSPYSVVYGHPLVDEPNVAYSGKVDQRMKQRVVRVDAGSGVVYQDQEWPTNRKSSTVGLSAKTRADAMRHRRLLCGLRGRQVAFWHPTAADDLLVVATLSSGSSTMDVERHGYVDNVQARGNKATFRIRFTDGATLLRRIVSATEQSAAVERLTLDSTWPSTKTAAEVARVEFLELLRLDADDVELLQYRVGRQTAVVPVTTVLDET